MKAKEGDELLESDGVTKRNLEDNLWICRECGSMAHEYFRI